MIDAQPDMEVVGEVTRASLISDAINETHANALMLRLRKADSLSLSRRLLTLPERPSGVVLCGISDQGRWRGAIGGSGRDASVRVKTTDSRMLDHEAALWWTVIWVHRCQRRRECGQERQLVDTLAELQCHS